MISTIFYIVLALLGISFLILIHELGHYWMARKLGITVEEFAIGFGKALYQKEKNGVKWKIGMIPFGGYVKMAGMEKKGGVEPHQVVQGFLGQPPLNQIKVAAMGPIANLAFAIVAFSLLWVCGGREKPFSEFTHHIGWVEPNSGPFKAEIRPGDEIVQINKKPFHSFESFLYRSIYDKGTPLQIDGYEIDYSTLQKTPFTYVFTKNGDVEGIDRALQALGTLSPAQYLIYDKMPSGADNALLPGSPLKESGIAYGDQILWVDGSPIFSKKHLVETLNLPLVLLTVKRDGKTFLARVPRLEIGDLRMTLSQKEEVDDWRYEARILGRVNELLFIPYNLDARCMVESSLSYIDHESRLKDRYQPPDRVFNVKPLFPGDRIIAVQGKKVDTSDQLLKELQTRRSLIIVKRGEEVLADLKWNRADQGFAASFDLSRFKEIIDAIGTDELVDRSGPFQLLKTVDLVPFSQFPLTEAQSKLRDEKLANRKEAIGEISNPKERRHALKNFKIYQKRLMLGIVLQDRLIDYNPSPFYLFGDAFSQVYKTLLSLVSGSLSPKNLAGPIGIVQVIQYGWSKGVKEALYWLGMISLNLGLLNLLPIPVLDGGHILFATWEGITKRPLSIQIRERLVYPFVIGLIALFVFLTYHDLARIFTRFF